MKEHFPIWAAILIDASISLLLTIIMSMLFFKKMTMGGNTKQEDSAADEPKPETPTSVDRKEALPVNNREMSAEN